jgi:hypothetical protein
MLEDCIKEIEKEVGEIEDCSCTACELRFIFHKLLNNKNVDTYKY